MNQMETDTPEVIKIKQSIMQLKTEHEDLDSAIHALTISGSRDQFSIARLKKKKLVLRDQIRKLEDMITPDIIA